MQFILCLGSIELSHYIWAYLVPFLFLELCFTILQGSIHIIWLLGKPCLLCGIRCVLFEHSSFTC